MLVNVRAAVFSAAFVMAVGFGAGGALAVPVHTSNTNVTSWDVGSGQVNGNFSVTSDQGFIGGPIELGLRAEQRSIGAVIPTGDSYTVLPGTDPTSGGTRAWWNFQVSIAYGDSQNPVTIADLTSLTLTISKDAGTNSSPSGTGVFDLKSVRLFIDDRNSPNSDANFGDIYQISQNPVFFPWFTPAYDLSPTSTFAYLFTVTATGRDGSSISSSMCVHTDGLSCATRVPEPGTLSLIGAGLALIGLMAWRRRLPALGF